MHLNTSQATIVGSNVEKRNTRWEWGIGNVVDVLAGIGCVYRFARCLIAYFVCCVGICVTILILI